MDDKRILNLVDHTLLKQTATWDEIRNLCDAGVANDTASVCIPPYYVKAAKEYVGGLFSICTVIGFPNGYSTTAVKVFETQQAVEDGADEIDMVINIGMLKDKNYNDILEEIKAIREACQGKLLKVIIETCLLTTEEKIMMCQIVTDAGAEYIKTSTGFSTGGATIGDVKLMKENIGPEVKIKAAGGVGNFDDAREFIAAGADRLGTSRLIH